MTDLPPPLSGHVSHADHGEDIILKVMFDTLGIPTPSYLDIGAFDPISISNTALLHWTGSRGINVEANPALIGSFYRLRPDDVNLNCAVGTQRLTSRPFYLSKNPGLSSFRRELVEEFDKEIAVETWTIPDILAGHRHGSWPDLLTIDIEGEDVAVIGSCLPNHGDRPTLVVVEHLRLTEDFSHEWLTLMPRLNYALAFRTRSNHIWIVNERREALLG